MKPIYYIVAFVLLISCIRADAQSQLYDWGVSVQPSLMSFTALENRKVTHPEEYGRGTQLVVTRYLLPSMDFYGDFARVKVRFPNGDPRLANETWTHEKAVFYDGSVGLKYKFTNGYILPEDFVFSPFLKAGFGLNKSVMSESLGFFIPVGIGFDVQVDKRVAFVFELNTKKAIRSSNDYLHHSLGLKFQFGKASKARRKKNAERKRNRHKKIAAKRKSKREKEKAIRIAAREEKKKKKNDEILLASLGSEKNSVELTPEQEQVDTDGDGVPDIKDICPDIKGEIHLMGCMDTDGDGTIDSQDDCPSLPGSARLHGCPEPDSDGDGIPNVEDNCPYKSGGHDTQGCPDRDGDKVADNKDICPDEVGDISNGGCPTPEPIVAAPMIIRDTIYATDTLNKTHYINSTVEVERPEETLDAETIDFCNESERLLTEIGQNIYFDKDRSRVRTRSKKPLKQVIKVINKCEGYSFIIIAHADKDGDSKYNLKLSEKRSKAIKEYLVGQGIDPSQLIIAAYGETDPALPNDSEENKAKNRRISFMVGKTK